MATRDEAFKASLTYFEGDEIAASKFVSKYALHDLNGDFKELTPADMHRRLAREFARIESKYPNPLSEQVIFEHLDHFRDIIPQGSPMSGIGNPYRFQSISNCFVVDSSYDSYGGIFRSDEEQVQIMKRRGGVGHDSLSNLRPKGLPTSNAAITSEGIEGYAERYSNSCREVGQGGRRGALMLTLNCHHPQVKDFIHMKEDLKKVTGANVSLKLTDEFLRAVEEGTQVELRFPVDKNASRQMSLMEDARSIWDEVMKAVWFADEPGILFWDTIIRRSPADIYAAEGFETISTNPCGEIPLCPYDSCRLMVVNLKSFVENPFTKFAKFLWDKFKLVVMRAQRLMDDMVDLEIECVDKILKKIESDPEPDDIKRVEFDLWKKIKKKALDGRRTGLGITALADMLAALGIKYGSDDSIEFVERVYRELAINSYKSSAIMASERGTFPIYDSSRETGHEFLEQLKDADPELRELIERHGRRNIACNTTAPVGTTSIMTQTSSGIENVFFVSSIRRTKNMPNDPVARVDFVDELGDKWTEHKVFHHGVKDWMRINGKTEADLEQSPYHGTTIADVDWEAKIRMQGAAQKWIDHSISNTTNIPESATVDDVKRIYMAGWKHGCKGVTIYREGTRTGVILNSEKAGKFQQHSAPKRPTEVPCDIHQIQIRGEKWTILVGIFEGKPYEIFGGLSRYIEIPKRYSKGVVIKHSRKTTNSVYDLQLGEGDDQLLVKDIINAFDNPNHSALTRIISLALRHGANIQYVVEQLQKERDSDMFSFSRSIARVLKSYIKDGTETTAVKKCGECGGDRFFYQEGCISCANCGWSKCG